MGSLVGPYGSSRRIFQISSGDDRRSWAARLRAGLPACFGLTAGADPRLRVWTDWRRGFDFRGLVTMAFVLVRLDLFLDQLQPLRLGLDPHPRVWLERMRRVPGGHLFLRQKPRRRGQ